MRAAILLKMISFAGVTVALAGMLRSAAQAQAQEQAPNPSRGASIYYNFCSACHGPLGHGDGSMAGFMALPPKDLANMSQPAKDIPYSTIRKMMPGIRPLTGEEMDDLRAFIGQLQRQSEAARKGAE